MSSDGGFLAEMASRDRRLSKQVLETVDESTLVEWAKVDPEAFGLLYERHVDRIYSYIYYRSGNRQDAEDLTARTFFKALDNIGRYTDRGVPFSAWLYRIAHNLVANWHRDYSKRKELSLDDQLPLAMSTGNPERYAEAGEAREALLSAIGRLSDDRQQLLLLKYIEAMPNAEIGEIMDKSEGAIKSLYHRTLLALRKDMTDHGFL
ncbi:MAG: sigma-70 family RNA polymerase sigma factor [Chloroflexota bacterium]|nr:sigma-70 family RNA polymerase sigma factor [Chloroflexota bacterium]